MKQKTSDDVCSQPNPSGMTIRELREARELKLLWHKANQSTQQSDSIADELTESVEALQGYFDAALAGEESRAKLFQLWKTQRSAIDAQIAHIRENGR